MCRRRRRRRSRRRRRRAGETHTHTRTHTLNVRALTAISLTLEFIASSALIRAREAWGWRISRAVFVMYARSMCVCVAASANVYRRWWFVGAGVGLFEYPFCMRATRKGARFSGCFYCQAETIWRAKAATASCACMCVCTRVLCFTTSNTCESALSKTSSAQPSSGSFRRGVRSCRVIYGQMNDDGEHVLLPQLRAICDKCQL